MKNYRDYKDKIEFPFEVSWKLDGVYAYAKDCVFWSKEHRRLEAPTAFFNEIMSTSGDKDDVSGELYLHRVDFEAIVSLVKNIKDNQAHKLVFVPHHTISRFTIDDPATLEAKLEEALSSGYEGLVIHSGGEMYKYKPVLDEEYTILDIIEGKGKLEGKAGKIVFDGFTAGIKGTHAHLAKLLADKESLIGRLATVEFQNKTANGIPRFPKVKSIRDYE
jgi:hypothetical protein